MKEINCKYWRTVLLIILVWPVIVPKSSGQGVVIAPRQETPWPPRPANPPPNGPEVKPGPFLPYLVQHEDERTGVLPASYGGVNPKLSSYGGTEPLRLVSKERQAELVRLLPRTSDGFLAELFAEQGATFYDRGNFGGINAVFPWRVTAGLDDATGATVRHFVAFGGPIKGGKYAPDTTFGEVLLLNLSQHVAFEVRTRTKQRDGSWEVAVYRPFPRAEDLERALLVKRPAVFDSQLLALLRGPQGWPHRVTDGRVIDRTAVYEYLPAFDQGLVHDLLAGTPFAYANGAAWRDYGKAGLAWAPSANGPSIVPQRYGGAFLKVGRKACMDCHREAGTNGIRGQDGIFSFDQNKYRIELVKAGLLK